MPSNAISRGPLPEWIESWRKNYESRKNSGERINSMVANLIDVNRPITGVIADRLISADPMMFPRKVWGGGRGLPGKRMKRLFDMLGIAEGVLPAGEVILLRFQVNDADWVPHPYNAPHWALRSPTDFTYFLREGGQYAVCKQWQKENDDSADKLVQARLVGLDVLSKATFVSPYVDVALWLDAHDPQLFDVRNIWRREAELAAIVMKLFSDAIREHTPQWLGWQRLDVYVPSRKLAFEYQGEQHYKPIEFFGGAEGYASNVTRDARKRQLCAANGVTLIEWKYTTPISEEYLLRLLASHGVSDLPPPN